MARLPTQDTLGERPIPRENGGVVSYNPVSGSEEAPALATASFAAKVQHAAEIEFDKINTTGAEDAWNKYRMASIELSVGEQGFSNKRAADAVTGELFKDYSGKLGLVRKQIEEALPNADMRQKFAARANTTDLQFKEGLVRHYSQERMAYEKNTFDGTVAAGNAMVAADPMNENTFNVAQENISRRYDALAASNGITDPAAIKAGKDKLVEGLLAKRIDTLLYSDPLAAESLFRLTEDRFASPEVRLTMQHRIREAVGGVQTKIDADKMIGVLRATPQKTPDSGSLVDTVIRFESNGNQAAVSPKGAIGVMQVMPDTAKDVAKSLGIKLDEERLRTDPEYNKAIGTRYLNDMLKKYDGNQTLALAAYNAGPGEVDKWIKKYGNPNKGDISEEEFASKIPFQETREYVSKINMASPPGQKLPPETNGIPGARDIRAQLPILLTRVEDQANSRYGKNPNNPDRAAYISRLTSEIKSRIQTDALQMEAVQRQAQGQLIDFIAGVGQQQGGMVKVGGSQGGMMVTSFSQIQDNPDMMRNWQLLDPAAKLGMERLMAHNLSAGEKGDNQLYRSLWDRVHLDPNDPNKINFYQQIIAPEISGRLSMKQIQELRAEIDRDSTPGGRSFNQMEDFASKKVDSFFKTNINFTAQPDRQLAATMKWTEDVGAKIDEYAKKNMNPRTLFMTDTPDSMVSSKFLDTYVNSTPAQGLAEQANKAMQVVTIKSDADYDALPDGAIFVDPKGKRRQKPEAPKRGATGSWKEGK